MKGMFFLLCKVRGNLVLSTTRFSKCAMDMCYLWKLCYKMEICHKSLLGNWTHVMEAMLLTARLTETCLSNGKFFCRDFRKVWHTSGKESVAVRLFLVGLKKEEKSMLSEKESPALYSNAGFFFWGGKRKLVSGGAACCSEGCRQRMDLGSMEDDVIYGLSSEVCTTVP